MNVLSLRLKDSKERLIGRPQKKRLLSRSPPRGVRSKVPFHVPSAEVNVRDTPTVIGIVGLRDALQMQG